MWVGVRGGGVAETGWEGSQDEDDYAGITLWSFGCNPCFFLHRQSLIQQKV